MMSGTQVVCDLVVSSKYLIPVIPEEEVLEDAAIAVKDGIILEVGKTTVIEAKYMPKERLDLGHQLITAGFVNAHTHAGMTHMRGMAEDLQLADWLANEIWPAESKFVDHEFTRDGTELAVAEMIKSGVTCLVDMYFFPEAAEEVFNKVGIRAMLGVPLLDFPTNYAKDFDEGLAKAVALMERNGNSNLVKFCVGPHAPYTVADENLLKAWTMAKKYQVPFTIHLHETFSEVDDSTHGRQSMSKHRSEQLCSPVMNFHRLGLIDPTLVAVHMTQLTDAEIAILAEKKANVVHCPESNLKLASGFCPVQKLLDAGVNVCLGTDSAASNNDLSMLGEIKTAALLGKMVAKDARAMKGQTTIRMATINGAKAAGLEKITGSLEPGKSADFISVDFDLLEFQPIFNPATALIYASQASHVTNVWVNGKRILKDKNLTTIDEDDLRKRVVSWNGHLKNHQKK